MTKNEKETKKPSKLQEMWSNPRGKAILKLGLWFLFFIFLFLLVSIMNFFSNPKTIISSKNPPVTEEIEFLELKEMFQNLRNQTFSYQYVMKNKKTSNLTTYEGTYQNGIEEGYRESKIGIIKYYIDTENAYQIVQEEKIPIQDLYTEESINYFKLNYLYDKIINRKSTFIKNGTKRIIYFETTEEKIEIETNQTEIKNIKIETEDYLYTLNFSIKKTAN